MADAKTFNAGAGLSAVSSGPATCPRTTKLVPFVSLQTILWISMRFR